ncbi:hypothetical protein [Acidovorax lacteus]|uniref:SDR family NAD(P)-dependent oxidoreductase n=1 Tax=Acidovorax lacteus TaxID=1924988 RepID=A0ABP8KWB3_9BURK
MLDASLHQGASLLSFMPQAQLRLLAVASQDDRPRNLEALWQLCAQWQRQGYPVVVLDGTTLESDRSPGLEHLLRQAPWKEGVSLDLGEIASSLAVIPAARGLHRLGRKARHVVRPPLADLCEYFRAYGMLVLLAPASVLAPLLAATAAQPLVLTTPDKAGVIDAYRNLKQLALEAGTVGSVVAVVPDDSARSRHAAHATLQNLQQCTQRHLGVPVRTATLNPDAMPDVQRLALQLLENAGTIGTSVQAPPIAEVPFARSH